MILKVENVVMRAKMMAKCIKIAKVRNNFMNKPKQTCSLFFSPFCSHAKHLEALNNFSTLMSFVAAFNNASIGRLKHTKKELPKKSIEELQSLETLMSPEANYKTYRTTIHSSNPPSIPYIGFKHQRKTQTIHPIAHRFSFFPRFGRNLFE
jgi:hypothetical protein